MQGSGQPGPALHERFARAIAKTVMAPGFVIARPRRGRGNLAVPCRISGKPRRKRDRLREIATSAVGLLAMTNLGAIAFLTLARTSRRCAAGRGQPGPSKCKKPGMPDFPASPIGSLTYRTVPWRGRGGRPRSGSSAAPRGPRCRWSRRRSCRRSYPHRKAPWQPRSACRASAP